MTTPHDPFWAGLGQAFRIGTELLAALIVGGALGWLVETYVWPVSPWGIVVGLIIGVTAGIRNVMRAARNWTSN